MSEVTFNIADYRPIAREGKHDHRGPSMRPRSGFVVLSSNSEPREYDMLETRPAVVDIRSVREMHRTHAQRGKVLSFTNPRSHRLYTMPAHHDSSHMDDDPGPMVA